MRRSQYRRRKLAAAYLHFRAVELQQREREEEAEEEEWERAKRAILVAAHGLAHEHRHGCVRRPSPVGLRC